MRIGKYIALFGLVILIGAAHVRQTDSTEAVLAKAGAVEVTAKQFRTNYTAYLLQIGLDDTPQLRKAFLQNMLAERLFIREVRGTGINTTPLYQRREAEVEQKLLVDIYLQRVLLDTLQVREAELKEMYVRVNTQLTAQHLYAETIEEANGLYAALQEGATFEELAYEIFNDPRLAESGGSLGTFSHDEMDAAFEEAAFALKIGEVSKPVKTAQGYSIIRLQDRFTKPVLTQSEYAEMLPKLQRLVMMRKQQAVQSNHVDALLAELALVFDEARLERLLGQVTGTALIENQEAFDDYLQQPLVTFGADNQRKTWTVSDLRERAQFTTDAQRARVRTRQDLTDFIEGLVVRSEMMQRARTMGLDETPAFQEVLDEKMDAFVLAQAKQRIAAEIVFGEEELRAFYESADADAFLKTDDDSGERMSFGEARGTIERYLRYQRARALLRQKYTMLSRDHPPDIDTAFLLEMTLTPE